MKNQLFSCIHSLFIILAFNSLAKAQTDYGDGTLQLNSSYSADWNSAQLDYTPRDSNSFSYNSKGLQTQIYTWQFDPTGQTWNPYFVNLQDYDVRNNLVSYIDSFLTAAEVENSYKVTYKFNSNDQEIQNIQSYWSTANSDWYIQERATTSYNADGQESLDLRESYEPISGKFINSILRTYTYGSQKNLEYYLKDVWDPNSSSWVNDYKVLFYSHLANNYTDSFIIQKYNSTLKVFENQSKFSYTYDGSNRLLTNSAFNWTLNTWVPERYQIYTYQLDGQVKEYIYQEWDPNSQKLINKQRLSYNYNGNNWLTADYNETWDTTNLSWQFYRKTTHEYNTQGYEIIRNELNFNIIASAWDPGTNFRYHYITKPIVNVKSVSSEITDFSIYPNPASKNITISSVSNFSNIISISIFNSIGSELARLTSKQLPLNSQLNFDLSNYGLNSGLYYLVLRSQDKLTRLPLVIK
ncbi:MAG: T9SS type A sorting domain-containing protein [Saprospiraceae bacterium]